MGIGEWIVVALVFSPVTIGVPVSLYYCIKLITLTLKSE